MGVAILYLFVDTNLFLQCRPLEELDWSKWNSFVEVRLIVSNPVLREIDHRKNKGSDRAGTRARTTSSDFRVMLSSGSKIVQDANPHVVLLVEPEHQPSKEVEHRLNYKERDDQLLGTIYEFARTNAGIDVRLLTHDTTPLYTARALDLGAEMIPDDWLLPPENSDKDRELLALRSENAKLKKAEPAFKIRSCKHDDVDINRYEANYTRYRALTDEEIEELVRRAQRHFPIETNFGPSEPMERDIGPPGFRIAGIKAEFRPASYDEIAKYRNQDYPRWLDEFRAVLRTYHRTLQRKLGLLTLVFHAENVGTRPASDALITIEAAGNFLICSPQSDYQNEEIDENQETARLWQASGLNLPPIAPRGRWLNSIGGNTNHLNTIDLLKNSLKGVQGLSAIDRPHFRMPFFEPPSPHDANAFYYKEGRPVTAGRAFSLKCDQWRHGDGEEAFALEICFEEHEEKIAGAVVCRIQAGNLSRSETKVVPVNILCSEASSFDGASELVDALASQQTSRDQPP